MFVQKVAFSSLYQLSNPNSIECFGTNDSGDTKTTLGFVTLWCIGTGLCRRSFSFGTRQQGHGESGYDAVTLFSTWPCPRAPFAVAVRPSR